MTAWKPHFLASSRGKRKFMIGGIVVQSVFHGCAWRNHIFYPLLNEKKSVFLLVKCLFNVWHASVVQWGVLCKSSEYSDNNKPHLTFCLLDTGCSHTVYRSEELLSQQFLGTDISLFTSFTVFFFFFFWLVKVFRAYPCALCGYGRSYTATKTDFGFVLSKKLQLFKHLCFLKVKWASLLQCVENGAMSGPPSFSS